MQILLFTYWLNELNVKNCVKQEFLVCLDNQISELAIRKNIELTLLGCLLNQVSQLDLADCTQLRELACDANVTAIGYTKISPSSCHEPHPHVIK